MTSPRERRIAIAIVLSTLALAAFFFAQGTVSLVATSLLGAGDPTPIDTPRATADSSASKHRDATAMLQRNIFDSESGDMTKLPEPAADTTAPLVEDANAPPTKCDGGTRLVAAVVSDKNPDWSFAAIADSAGKTLLYRKGSEVSGKRVVTVTANLAEGGLKTVLVEAGLRIEQVTVFDMMPMTSEVEAVAVLSRRP